MGHADQERNWLDVLAIIEHTPAPVDSPGTQEDANEIVTIEVRSRHIEDYRLTNVADGTTWRVEGGIWVAAARDFVSSGSVNRMTRRPLTQRP
jgi:hypothetical protein